MAPQHAWKPPVVVVGCGHRQAAMAPEIRERYDARLWIVARQRTRIKRGSVRAPARAADEEVPRCRKVFMDPAHDRHRVHLAAMMDLELAASARVVAECVGCVAVSEMDVAGAVAHDDS